jgi:L-aspartate oxidase
VRDAWRSGVGQMVDEVVTAEVVVVGAGAAGMRAALAASPRSVQLLTAGALGATGSSPLAQGGVAAALGSGDSPAQHCSDTLAAAAGSADADAVRHLVEEGPGEIRWLEQMGARFDHDEDGALALGREAAHSHPRIVHAGGDATGAEVSRVLARKVSQCSSVRVMEQVRVDSLVRSGSRVVGVLAVHRGGRLVLHRGAAVILATGGLGGLYLKTTNPASSFGAGVAMAALAGARLVDLEYIQFHPTALDVSAETLPLLTEALRGAGARLVDASGSQIMAGAHPAGDLAPRDVVARAVWAHRNRGADVYLDARSVMAGAGAERFPTVLEVARQHGLDPESEPLPVTPAAHFAMGGIWTDLSGRTSVSGLWACGETACSGVHGANRLASNSLLETQVFGRRVGESVRASRAASFPLAGEPELEEWQQRASVLQRAEVDVAESALRRLMWQRVGLSRNETGLRQALEQMDSWAKNQSVKKSIALPLLVARMVATSALARRESRGSHFRSDYSSSSPAGMAPIVVGVEGWAGGVPEVSVLASPRTLPMAAAQGASL